MSVGFGASVLFSYLLRGRSVTGLYVLLRRIAGRMSIVFFVAALFSTITAGVAMPLLFFLHTRG
jgi:hypothetical protein